MVPAFRVFISCVSDEFRSYRTSLRNALTSAGREIKIQEDFSDGAGTLLEKLDNYICRCQAMVHLVGDGVGSKAKPAEVRWLLERHPNFADVLKELGPFLTPESCPFSYTQWECFLALYHRVPCYIYLADKGSAREPAWSASDAAAAEQRTHIERLRSLGQDRRREVFLDARDIALKFLNSYYSDGGQVAIQPGTPPTFEWPASVDISSYPLADREDEFVAFSKLVTGRSQERALLIHGPSDRGKSVLLAQFYAVVRRLPGLHAGFAEFKTSLPLREVLRDARRELQRLRFPRFSRELERDAPEMLRAAFLQDLEEATEPVVLIFDAYEQAADDTRAWFEDRLLPLCRNHAGLRLVVAGKIAPAVDRAKLWFDFVKCRELPPISSSKAWCDYSHRVVGLTSLPSDHVATLVMAAQGSPRAVGSLLENLKRAAPPA